MYVTTPNEKLMVKPCSFTNTAAATGTYIITAVNMIQEKYVSGVLHQ